MQLAAFEAVLADLEGYGPLDASWWREMLSAGQNQAAILRRLVEMDAVMIQGNNEQAMARMAAGTAPDYFFTSKQFAIPALGRSITWTRSSCAWCCGLPEQRVFTLPGADPIRVAHGSPRNINELVVPPSRANLSGDSFRTARMNANTAGRNIRNGARAGAALWPYAPAWKEQVDGRLAMNPGAVCFPENGLCWRAVRAAGLGWAAVDSPQHYEILTIWAPFSREQASGFYDTGILAGSSWRGDGWEGSDSRFLSSWRTGWRRSRVRGLPLFPG